MGQQQLGVQRSVFMWGLVFFVFFSLAQKDIFPPGQNEVGLILATHPHNGETQMALKKNGLYCR